MSMARPATSLVFASSWTIMSIAGFPLTVAGPALVGLILGLLSTARDSASWAQTWSKRLLMLGFLQGYCFAAPALFGMRAPFSSFAVLYAMTIHHLPAIFNAQSVCINLEIGCPNCDVPISMALSAMARSRRHQHDSDRHLHASCGGRI
eukprot:SAG11_NODE_177_length_13334_cov_9.614280_10_plen_149_part_00